MRENKKLFGDKKILITTLILCFIAGLLMYYKKNEKSPSSIAQHIYMVLEKYRVTYDIDAHSVDPSFDTAPQKATGVEQCIQNLAYFVEKEQPIEMLLVGFPFKSHNTDKKVLGYLPDMAERKSLEYLQSMLSDIKKIYAPGAHILVFCDGVPFAEFFGIPLENVVAYEQQLKKMSSDLPDITINTSDDVMKKFGVSSVKDIITLIDTYEPSDEQFRKEAKALPEVALKRFALELDHPAGKKLIEQYTLPEIVTRLLAREMRLRSFIMKEYPSPEYFRLTVHLSADVSKKFGVKLSPSSDITPYHGVMVQNNDGSWYIKFKKDVDMNKYEHKMMMVNGDDYGYYQQMPMKG